MHVPHQDNDPVPGPLAWIEAPPPMTLERLTRLLAAEAAARGEPEEPARSSED